MYKSKLQELCQKQKWALPKYTYVKDGEDHCPLFKASVVIGGLSFNAPAACKSSKQALDQAAQLAFLHFSSAKEDPSNGSGKKINVIEKGDDDQSSASSEPVAVKRDFRDEFKKKLQIYIHRKNLDSPIYHIEKEGPCFRAMVSIGDDWFPSDGLFETVEEAEDSAAQAALLSLSTDALHQNDPARSYKILLQDLITNEFGFSLPKYKTVKSIDSNDFQTFLSTVEVGGEVFKGAAEKTKKLAELNAAKAAYTVFMERKLFHRDNISPKSSTITMPDISRLNIKNSEKIKTKSYLLCNRFKIFTCIPDTSLPEGTTVLPVGENRWTIFSLEFPNEKGM